MPSKLSSFSFTGNEQTWTVPEFIETVRVELNGGSGRDGGTSGDGSHSSGTGGDGSYIKGDFSVTTGDTLYIYVGGGNGSTWPNGGNGPSRTKSDPNTTGRSTTASAGNGGGSSDVRYNNNTLSDRIVVAAGGGGGGAASAHDLEDGQQTDAGYGGTASGGDGGGASTDTRSASGGTGGGSTDENGVDGITAQSSGTIDIWATATGGGGGGHTGGDTGTEDGTSSGNNGDAEAAAGGGGAGDNYTGGISVISASNGANAGNGNVKIRYSDRITNLSVDTSIEGEITLQWSEPLDVNSYSIYRAEASGNTVSDYTKIASSIPTGTTEYTDTGLEDGEEYYYRVENVNSFDNRLSNEPSGITLLPEPTNLSGSYDQQNLDMTLTWDRNDSSTDGSVSVERSTDGGSTWTEIATGLAYNATSYTDTNINPFTVARYRITRITPDTSITGPSREFTIAGSDIITSNGIRDSYNGSATTE